VETTPSRQVDGRGDVTRTELPVVEPPFDTGRGGTTAEPTTIVGIVLAAGTSSRFGEPNKLLAEWRGDPILRHATRTLCRSRVDHVVVVVGHEHERVRAAIDDCDVTVVDNDDYEDGQATSVRRGVTAARERDARAAVFALGDMPGVAVESVDRLVRAYRADVGDPLAAACDGSRGNPVLFGARHFDALTAVTGDAGGREILLRDEQAALVETGDRGVLVDVDRVGDVDSL
jgi:molybdenum cofactor cytidylyltransferase